MAAGDREKVDRLIERVGAQLRNLPWVESHFSDWDQEERTAFLMEWSIPEGKLRELEKLSEQGLMSEQQEERFAELRRLAKERAPILKRLRRASA